MSLCLSVDVEHNGWQCEMVNDDGMCLSATGLWVGWTEPFNVAFDVARRKGVGCCPDLLVMRFHLIIIRSVSPAQVQQQRNDVSLCCCIDGSSDVAASVVLISSWN
jgi:hypothetical protein